MVLNKYRDQADTVLEPLAKKMSSVDPNLISWLSLLFAFAAGLSFFFYTSGMEILVLLGGVFIVINSLLDALDGKVAKLTGKASLKGDFLDHTIDRYADILILGGLILGPLVETWIGVLALIGVLMTSYMGTQADAVGVSRDYGGIAGRAERLVLLILISLLYFSLSGPGWNSYHIWEVELNMFELLMIWFAISGNLTAIYRGSNTWSSLEKK